MDNRGHAPDIEKARKTNFKLAIGIAAAGLVLFMLTYAVLFSFTLVSPVFIMRMMPFTTVMSTAVGLGDNLYVFSKDINIKEAAPKWEPEERPVMRVYDGTTLSDPADIKPFHSTLSATSDGKKAYLLDKGVYRTFDGISWEERADDRIGEDPVGAAGPGGLWVLSNVEEKQSLILISGGGFSEFTVPEDMKIRAIYWYAQRLHAFVDTKDNVFGHYVFDGSNWERVGTVKKSVYPRFLEHGGKLYLFMQEGQPSISMRVFDGRSWAEPSVVIKGLFINFSPTILKGRPTVYTQGLMTRSIHVLGEDGTFSPTTISESWGWLHGIALLSAVPTALFLIFIMIASLVMDRVKLSIWHTEWSEYEFASLFRRFVAKLIDTVLASLPFFAIVAVTIKGFDFTIEGMIRTVLVLMSTAFLYILFIFLYHSLLEGIWGKTFGKMVCGIEVLKDDFTKCTLGAAFLRNLVRIADNFFYYFAGIVAISATLKWQRLGDLAASTVVVKSASSTARPPRASGRAHP